MTEKQTETQNGEMVNPATGEVVPAKEGKAIAKAPKESPQTVGAFLRTRQTNIAAVCPPGVKPEKVINTVAVLVSSKPELRGCTFESIFLAVMQGCELGLSFNPGLGECYIIGYKDQAQFRPGYRGLVKLAKEEGGVRDIEAHVVREGDDFDYALGLNPRLEHVPALRVEPGAITHVYAVAWMPSGRVMVEVMSKAQVDHIRDKHAAAGSMMWRDHYDEAARKTVLRRLCKHIPGGERMGTAMAADNDEAIETTADTGERATGDLKTRLAAKAGEVNS